MTDESASHKKTPEELHEIRMANLRPHMYPQGTSGNPEGRPKGKTVASEIRQIINEQSDKGEDIARALARVAIQKALKGDYRYFEAVREIIDGPRAKGAGVNITGNMIQVVFEDLQPPPDWNPPRMPSDVDEV